MGSVIDYNGLDDSNNEMEDDEIDDKYFIDLNRPNPLDKLIDCSPPIEDEEMNVSFVNEDVNFRELMNPNQETVVHLITSDSIINPKDSLKRDDDGCIKQEKVYDVHSQSELEEIDDELLLAIDIEQMIPTKEVMMPSHPVEHNLSSHTTHPTKPMNQTSYTSTTPTTTATTNTNTTTTTTAENNISLDKSLHTTDNITVPFYNNESPYFTAITPTQKKSNSSTEFLYLPCFSMIKTSKNVLSPCLFDNIQPEENENIKFKFKHLSDPDACELFFSHLKQAPAVSFELIYKQLPLPISEKKNSYNMFCVYRPHMPLYKICQEKELTLAEVCQIEKENTKHCCYDSNEAGKTKTIAGVALSLGNDLSFYLPLPTPIFLGENDYFTEDDTSKSSSSLSNNSPHSLKSLKPISFDCLPYTALVLISRFIGYIYIYIYIYINMAYVIDNDKILCIFNRYFNIFNKSPIKRFISKSKLKLNQSTITRSSLEYPNSVISNPFMLVSKKCMKAAKKGFIIEVIYILF